jgi:hypothetical protein
MMVTVNRSSSNKIPPTVGICKECLRVPDPAEGKHWLGRKFQVERYRLRFKSQPPVLDQAHGGRKNREFREFLNSSFDGELIVHASENNQIRPTNRGKRFTKTAAGEEKFLAEWPRCIDKEDIEIARKMQVLKTIVEQEDVNGLRGFELLACNEAVRSDTE